MKGLFFKKGLSGNALKLIALVAMTVDHVAQMFFSDAIILRIIGRIAYPIFAFMIAEGCFYSRHKLRYFLTVLSVGVLCVLGFYIFLGKFYLNIFITFALSMSIIFAIQYAVKNEKTYLFFIPAVLIFLSAFLDYYLPSIIGADAQVLDYGFFGVLLPVAIYLFKDFRIKLLALSLMLVPLALSYESVQWFAFLSLPLIAFYDGTRGKFNFKYLFYIYYPLHFMIIYGIALLI